MKTLLTTALCALSVLLYAQTEFEAKNLIISNEATGKLRIEKYSNVLMYKNEKCSFPPNSPENQFCNFFNLNTQNELIAFFAPYSIPLSYSKEDYLDKMKIYNKKKNYYSLESKYIFDYGVSKDIFIKYINYNEVFPKPTYSVIYLQDFENNLRIKDMGENFDLGLFLISSNTSQFINYLMKLNKKEINITLFCNNFLKDVKSNPDKGALYSLIDKQYSPFFNNNKLMNIDSIVHDSITYNFRKSFYDIINGIILKKNKAPKEKISKKYNIPISYLTKDSLSVKEVINIKATNNDFIIIKFYDFNTIIKSDYRVLGQSDVMLYKNILSVLTKINFEVFVNLYSNEKSKKFPDLNQIKELIKDKNGNLDISKLLKTIEEKKSIFTQYLNE